MCREIKKGVIEGMEMFCVITGIGVEFYMVVRT